MEILNSLTLLLFVLVLGVARFAGSGDAFDRRSNSGSVLLRSTLQPELGCLAKDLARVGPDFVRAAVVFHHRVTGLVEQGDARR